MKKTDFRTNSILGFTLVEVIVVIAIIALLSVIIYASFGGVKAQGRDQKRVADMGNLQLNLELYFNKNKQYPQVLQDLVPEFLPELPIYSGEGVNYAYNYFPLTRISGGKCVSYQLWTTLETRTSVLDSKKSFDSSVLVCGVNSFCECGSGHSTAVNASSNQLIFDVMP